MLLQTDGIYEGMLEAGARLARTPEAEGGWAEYFMESDEGDLRIEDDILRAQTALMLENAKRWMARTCHTSLDEKGRLVLHEATRSAMVGGFADYIFPVIRAAFPTNPIADLVSVQPTTRSTATVVFWNWIVGKTKGSYVQGQKIFDANTGWQDGGQDYSSSRIVGETAVVAGTTIGTTTLAYNSGGGIVPGSFSGTFPVDGSPNPVVVDDGQGLLVAVTGTIASGTINYATGLVTIDFETGDVTNADATVSYAWNSEGSADLPEVDVQITTSTAKTERRALKLNYSTESMQDVMAEFGVSLEPALVQGVAETINVETARQIISEIWNAVPKPGSAFSVGPRTNLSRLDQFMDFVYELNVASNVIWAATQKGYGNWLVVDKDAASMIESMPSTMFVRAPKPPSVHGLHFIGTLSGQFRVYKDLHLDKLPGASANGNLLMGYKGNQFFDAGYVWSPYQMLYSTPTTTLSDFNAQKGMASRYATKMVNPAMYTRIDLKLTP